MRELKPVPLTAERFARYGDVIDTSGATAAPMNEARFSRFDDLCNVDVADGQVSVSITTAHAATELPYAVTAIERHPLGSQAFIPLSPCRMIVVVAPAAEQLDPTALEAFETNGEQGINYARGVWHMPLIALGAGQRYLIIDRGGDQPNCDIEMLDEPLLLRG